MVAKKSTKYEKEQVIIVKKQQKFLLICTVVILGLGTVGSVNAAVTDNKKIFLDFEKGGLDLIPINPSDPANPNGTTSDIVPTFDFGKIIIGNISERLVAKEGDSNSKSLLATGVANYLGDGTSWSLLVKASNFTGKDVKTLENVTVDFSEIAARQVIGNQGIKNLAGNKKVQTGGSTVPVFTSEPGEVGAGKFQLDYTKTKLKLPSKAASQAKPAAYEATITWNLSAVVKGNKHLAASTPLK